jgi:uncharacterized protein (DUF1697 family)
MDRYVAFLRGMNIGGRRIRNDDLQLYWLPSGGISESELDLNAIGATLGLTTMRTKGTIDQITAKHFS